MPKKKYTPDKIKSVLDIAEENIGAFEDITIEMTQENTEKKKEWGKTSKQNE